MSRLEFVEQHRHEIVGWILDAVLDPQTGAALALQLRTLFKRVDAKLAGVYDQLQAASQALVETPVDLQLPRRNGVVK